MTLQVGQQVGVYVIEKELKPRCVDGHSVRVFRIRCSKCGSRRRATSNSAWAVLRSGKRCRHCPVQYRRRGPYGPYRIEFSESVRNTALTQARLNAGLTQADVDEYIGASYPFTNYIERYNWGFVLTHCTLARFLRYVTEIASLLKVPVETVIDPSQLADLVFNDETVLQPLPDTTPNIAPAGDPAVEMETQEEIALMREAMESKLSQIERDMVVARIWAKETLEQIGQRHNLTRERVRQIVNTATRRICLYLNQRYRGLFEVTRTKGFEMNSYFRLVPIESVF